MRLDGIPYYMLRSLIITALIEVLLAFILSKRKRDLINVILANMITNPLVVTIPIYFGLISGVRYSNISLLLLELITVLIEGLLYKKYNSNRVNPWVLSTILNISSFCLGSLINMYF